MGGARPWMTSGIAASAACLASACLLAPPRPGEAGGDVDGGAPDAATPFSACTVQPAALDSGWTRTGDSFTRAEGRTLSVWHQVDADVTKQLFVRSDGDGSGTGTPLYSGASSTIDAFERPQLLRDGSRLLVTVNLTPHELALSPSGVALSPPTMISTVPPLPELVTLGGPSGGLTPRAIASKRLVEDQDLVEIALVDDQWTYRRTIPLAELGVTAAGTASLDASGGRIVFMGRLQGASTDAVLTSTRETLDGAFSQATVLYIDSVNTLADPWLDDACRHLYVSNYTFTSVLRLTINP